MQDSPISRRNFIAKSSAMSGAAMVSSNLFGEHHAAGKKPLRIGWVGTGDRGSYDVRTCMKTIPHSELIAVADLFQDKIDAKLPRIREEIGDRVKLTKGTTFLGFDGYRKILEMDEVDVVFLYHPRQASARTILRRPSMRENTSTWKNRAQSMPWVCVHFCKQPR